MWPNKESEKWFDRWYYDVWYGQRSDRCLGFAEVSNDGWVIYSINSRSGGGYWDGAFFLILMDGDKRIEDYEITEDEFWSFPNMPEYWYTPF